MYESECLSNRQIYREKRRNEQFLFYFKKSDLLSRKNVKKTCQNSVYNPCHRAIILREEDLNKPNHQ